MKHFIMRPIIFGHGRSTTLRVVLAETREEALRKADDEFKGDMHVVEAECETLVIHS